MRAARWTITDFASRYLLNCEALLTTQETFAFTVFERTFREFGLPQVIRTYKRRTVRLRPRDLRAQQTLGLVATPRHSDRADQTGPSATEGRLERMHLTLKQEATKPAAANVLQQQARFDTFIEQYNHERPHQALKMKVPADVYVRSPRIYRGLDELTYPFHDQTITVTHCGRICFKGRKVNLSHVFAGQTASRRWASASGSSPSCSTIWATSTTRSAGWSRSRIRSARKCYLCARNELPPM
jgi:putative transposase